MSFVTTFCILAVFFIGQVQTVASEELKKVFVVIKENSEAQLEAALDYAEIKLTQAEVSAATDVQFEIYAFDTAIELFTVQKSLLEERLKQTIAEYPSLKIFACGAKKERLLVGVQPLDKCEQQIDQRRRGNWFEFEVHQADD